MKKGILVWFCVAVLVVMGCSPGSDSPDSFGNVGTLGDSWIEIWDWHDLDAIRDNLDGNYVLMTDLDSTTAGYDDLAGPDANDGKGWEPIGTYAEPFTGTLDGQGYEISDLFINRPGEAHVGLFSSLGYPGVVGVLLKALRVVNANVTGDGSVGGLVGIIRLGTVRDSCFTGTVTGGRFVGGLVGGFSYGTVSDSYFTGTVIGDEYVGGLAGNIQYGTLSNSYSIGSVTGSSSVGGLVGVVNMGTVSNSYYSYDEVLINDQNIITIGALFGQDFEEWLANDRFLDVDDRLSKENGYYVINNVSDFKHLLSFGQDDSLSFRLKDDLTLVNEPNFYIPYLAGEFRGDGHIISNLSFSFGFVSQVGLFGYLASGGEVGGVGVENVNITGGLQVGGLVGFNRGGTVDNCYSTGSVTGGWRVGGLTGHNFGTVSDSHSDSDVVGVDYVGGLVGWNWFGTVDSSYSTGSVTGERCVGGLVGYSTFRTVSNSYSTGDVTGGDRVGGLVGGNVDATVRDSYSTGTVAGEEYVGGLVGGNVDGTVSNSYYDYDAVLINGQSIITIGALFGPDFSQWLAQGKFLDVDERLSQENDYYLINDVGDLKQLLAFGQDDALKFRLTDDLDLGNDPGYYIPYLAGEFDGNGHKVSNVSFNFDLFSHVGLFGYLATGSKISQVGVEDANITGRDWVGGLVGLNHGALSNSYAGGSVSGELGVGSLVGRNHGTVSNSYASGSVSGRSQVGGLVGRNHGTVSNSYASGSVSGEFSVGGLVGMNAETVSDSFYDMETSSQSDTGKGEPKTTAEMKDIGTLLTAGWDIEFTLEADPTNGYPFLSWQLGSSPIWYIYAIPIVITEAATQVSTDSATLNMNFTVGDYSPVEVRFSWREEGEVDWATITWTERTASGTHAETLTGLDSDTTYEFRAQVGYDTTVIDGAVLTFTTDVEPIDPTATTEPATDLTTSAAVLHGDLDIGDETSVDVFFRYRETGAVAWQETVAQSMIESGPFEAQVTGLTSNTEHQFRAAVQWDGQEDLGDIVTFTTQAIEPTVTTEPATDVATDSATLNMEFIVGDYSPVDVRLNWREVGTDPWAETIWTSMAADGTHAETLTGLDSNITYEFKAQLQYDDTVIEGDTLTFTTAVEPIDPTATTEPATDVATSAAVLHGDLDIGDETLVDVFFRYRETVEETWQETSPQETTVSGAFEAAVTELTSNTEHEFKAVVRWGGQENVGDVLTLTTEAIEPTVTTEPANDVTTDTATLNMELTVGDYSAVEVRFNWREEGTDPWTETTWTSRAADGTHAETLTGLESDTTYEFYAQLKYNESVIDGATLTFTTAVEPVYPTVTAEPATDVATSAAVLRGDLDIADETSVDVFFRYREKGEVDWIETSPQYMTESGPFEAQVTGLTSNTEHQFRPVVQWDGQEDVGDVLSFTTLAIEPTVTTEPATDVTTDSATIDVEFTVGSYSPVEVRFRWREVVTDVWTDTTWTSKAADGTHAETLTGLDSNTTYEFRAQLRHNAAVVDGDALTFTTKEEIPAVCVPTDTGTGMACLTASHGTIEDLQAVPALSPAPIGVNFPHGMFEFKITGLAEGATVTLTVELPEAVPVGTVWWKYEDGSWYPLPNESDDGDNIMTIKLTDGDLGDTPGSDPGTIVDPGGPGNPVPPLTVGWEGLPVNKAAVMAPWIALLSAAIAGSSFLVLRRRRVQI